MLFCYLLDAEIKSSPFIMLRLGSKGMDYVLCKGTIFQRNYRKKYDY